MQEKVALKKLENVRSDHAKRLDDLAKEQTTDMQKAQLIEVNLSLVTSPTHYTPVLADLSLLKHPVFHTQAQSGACHLIIQVQDLIMYVSCICRTYVEHCCVELLTV